MKQATNIEDQKENAKEFAQIVEKVYRDFQNTSFVKEDGLRCLISILNDDILDEWKKQGIKFDKNKDFIPIQNGLFYVCLDDALGRIIPLQE